MKEVPQYIHNCSCCVFLGRFDFDGLLSNNTTIPLRSDLYVCERGRRVVLVGRFSDEGSDYITSLRSLIERDEDWIRKNPSTTSPALIEALSRLRKENV